MLLNKKKNKALSVMYLLIFLSKNFKAAWEVTRKKLLMLFGTKQTIPPTRVLTLNNVGCINKDALMKVIRQLYVFKTLKSNMNRQTEVLTSPFNWSFYTFSVPAAHFYTFMVFTVNSSKQ